MLCGEASLQFCICQVSIIVILGHAPCTQALIDG